MRSRILVVPWFLAMWIAVLAGLSAVAPASAHAQHWELRAGAALPLGELAERGVGTGLGIDLGLRLPVGRRGFARALAGGYRAPGDLGSAFYALHYQVGMGIVGEALPAGWTVSGGHLVQCLRNPPAHRS